MLDHLQPPIPYHPPTSHYLGDACVFSLLPVTNYKPSSRFISLRADWICDARRRRRSCLKEANSKTQRYDNARRGYCRVDGRAACDTQTYGRIPHVCSAAPISSHAIPEETRPPLAQHLSCLRGFSVVIVILNYFQKVLPSIADSCFLLASQIKNGEQGLKRLIGGQKKAVRQKPLSEITALNRRTLFGEKL